MIQIVTKEMIANDVKDGVEMPVKELEAEHTPVSYRTFSNFNE